MASDGLLRLLGNLKHHHAEVCWTWSEWDFLASSCEQLIEHACGLSKFGKRLVQKLHAEIY